MVFLPLNPLRIEPAPWYNKFHTTVDVLRLDAIHPVVSGNKWFKLRYHLEEALQGGKKALLTFGGAYSNHILATAAAAKAAGLPSIGIIRGGDGPERSATLLDAEAMGMMLYFMERQDYAKKIIPEAVFRQFDASLLHVIPEGGYDILGAQGAATILHEIDGASYTHIIAATGTGTMLAGLAMGCAPHQKAMGISVLKNHHALDADITALGASPSRFETIHGFHFGGYAKSTPALIGFMNVFYSVTGIPTDFVYTGKLFYAIDALFSQQYFNKKDRLLVIHSGGLQGNRSLPKGTLIF